MNPIVRLTRSRTKRLESMDSDSVSERSNTPLVFDVESNRSETSPNFLNNENSSDKQFSSGENKASSRNTPTKRNTRRAQSEAKNIDVVNSPIGRVTRRAGSVSSEDNNSNKNIGKETRSSSATMIQQQQAPTPARRVTRRSSFALLLNDSIELTSVPASPSRRGRKRSISINEEIDEKDHNKTSNHLTREINLLNTCVPEEDTVEENSKSIEKKRCDDNKYDNNDSIKLYPPALSTRSRSKSPNESNLTRIDEDKLEDENQEVNEVIELLDNDSHDVNAEKVENNSNNVSADHKKQENNEDVKDINSVGNENCKQNQSMKTDLNECNNSNDGNLESSNSSSVILQIEEENKTCGNNTSKNLSKSDNSVKKKEDILEKSSSDVDTSKTKENENSIELNTENRGGEEETKDESLKSMNTNKEILKNNTNQSLNQSNLLQLNNSSDKENNSFEEEIIKEKSNENSSQKNSELKQHQSFEKTDNITISNTKVSLLKSLNHGGTENSITPFKKRMSNELTASSTPIISNYSTVKLNNDNNNDFSSKFELSTTQTNNNEENNSKLLNSNQEDSSIKKNSMKKQSVSILHSEINDKSSKFPKTPIPSKYSKNYLDNIDNDDSIEDLSKSNDNMNDSVSQSKTKSLTNTISTLNLSSECNTRKNKSLLLNESKNDSGSHIDFAKSWSHPIKGSANTSIDTFGLKKNDENNLKINENSMEKSKKSINNDKSIEMKTEKENILEDEEEKEEESREKNEFIDDEAEECEDDSMDSEEREYLKQNEIPEHGESLGSHDTNDGEYIENVEEEDEVDEEMASFIVSDAEEQEENEEGEEEEIGENDDEENYSSKRKPMRILSSEDEEESDKVDEEFEEKGNISLNTNSNSSNKEMSMNNSSESENKSNISVSNSEIDVQETEKDTKKDLGETVEGELLMSTILETTVIEKSFSKKNKKDVQSEVLLTGGSLIKRRHSLILCPNKKDSNKKDRHSLPARKPTLDLPNDDQEMLEEEEKQKLKESNDDDSEESANNSLSSSESKTSKDQENDKISEHEDEEAENIDRDESSQDTSNSNNYLPSYLFEEHSSNEEKKYLPNDNNKSIEKSKRRLSAINLEESLSKKEKEEGKLKQQISTDDNDADDPYTRIMKRCDEILKAELEAKQAAKSLNKNKKKNIKKKNKKEKKKQEENITDENPIEKACKFGTHLLLKQIKHKSEKSCTESEEDLPKEQIKLTSTKTKRLPDEIVNAIEQSPSSKKEKISKKSLKINEGKSSNDETKQLKSIKRKLPESDVEQEENLKTKKKKKNISGIIRSAAGLIFEEPITPKKTDEPKILEFPWGTVREEPITPNKNKMNQGFKETQITPKSTSFKIEDTNKSKKINKKNKNDKDKSVQEYSWGTVYEEPISVDSNKIKSKEINIGPKSIGHKMKIAMSSGQIEPPALNKSLKKKKKNKIPEPINVLPKPTWIRTDEFQPKSSNIEGIHIKKCSSSGTDFFVKPLKEKKQKRKIDEVSEAALDFKRKALFNEKIPRETSKQLLHKKEKQLLNNKF